MHAIVINTVSTQSKLPMWSTISTQETKLSNKHSPHIRPRVGKSGVYTPQTLEPFILSPYHF